MEIVLRARHFKDAVFREPCNCPIALAAQEVFEGDRITEAFTFVKVDGKYYSHKAYLSTDYEYDFKKAKSLDFSDRAIRTIQLTEGWKQY